MLLRINSFSLPVSPPSQDNSHFPRSGTRAAQYFQLIYSTQHNSHNTTHVHCAFTFASFDGLPRPLFSGFSEFSSSTATRPAFLRENLNAGKFLPSPASVDFFFTPTAPAWPSWPPFPPFWPSPSSPLTPLSAPLPASSPTADFLSEGTITLPLSLLNDCSSIQASQTAPLLTYSTGSHVGLQITSTCSVPAAVMRDAHISLISQLLLILSDKYALKHLFNSFQYCHTLHIGQCSLTARSDSSRRQTPLPAAILILYPL